MNTRAITWPWPGARSEIGPTVIAHGTEAQQDRYLRPLASCEEIWCQLFSEPAGGSDVAGLRTRAEKNGDDWIINGQKIWTSRADSTRRLAVHGFFADGRYQLNAAANAANDRPGGGDGDLLGAGAQLGDCKLADGVAVAPVPLRPAVAGKMADLIETRRVPGFRDHLGIGQFLVELGFKAEAHARFGNLQLVREGDGGPGVADALEAAVFHRAGLPAVQADHVQMAVLRVEAAAPFVVAYTLIFLTALVTISTQVRRIVHMNPADVLRNE